MRVTMMDKVREVIRLEGERGGWILKIILNER